MFLKIMAAATVSDVRFGRIYPTGTRRAAQHSVQTWGKRVWRRIVQQYCGRACCSWQQEESSGMMGWRGALSRALNRDTARRPQARDRGCGKCIPIDRFREARPDLKSCCWNTLSSKQFNCCSCSASLPLYRISHLSLHGSFEGIEECILPFRTDVSSKKPLSPSGSSSTLVDDGTHI